MIGCKKQLSRNALKRENRIQNCAQIKMHSMFIFLDTKLLNNLNKSRVQLHYKPKVRKHHF